MLVGVIGRGNQVLYFYVSMFLCISFNSSLHCVLSYLFFFFSFNSFAIYIFMYFIFVDKQDLVQQLEECVLHVALVPWLLGSFSAH